MKKLFVLGIALFLCLFFVGCSRVTTPPVIPDNVKEGQVLK
jgi:PBP1b-binding outer membrane lipoprotein LpoB